VKLWQREEKLSVISIKVMVLLKRQNNGTDWSNVVPMTLYPDDRAQQNCLDHRI